MPAIKKDIDLAYKIGFRMGCELMDYFHTPKRKRDVINHVEYCNLLYKQFDQLKEKC